MLGFRFELAAVAALFSPGVFAAPSSAEEDCLGVSIPGHSDSAFYHYLHPWIDTAADSAHYPIIQGDCASSQGCSAVGFSGSLYDLIPRDYSQAQAKPILEAWAADLNADFQLYRVRGLDPLVAEPFSVDSTYDYLLGPYLWITKEQILALSKKCYLSQIRKESVPVSVHRDGPEKGKWLRERRFNIKGQEGKAGERGRQKGISPEYRLRAP